MTSQGKPPSRTKQLLSLDSFHCRRVLEVGGRRYLYYSLPEAEKNGLPGISRLPFSLKVLLENLLRHEDGTTVTADDIRAFVDWLDARRSEREIAYRPARVLMQDFTGVPAVVDLAAMRDAMRALGGAPERINPIARVDLVIDHSVMVDYFASPQAFERNVAREYERNRERYQFLKWGSEAFDNFHVVPPGTGICHQVNLEYLAQTVWTRDFETDIEREGGAAAGDAEGVTTLAFPDTCVGTDSHTTMINGLSVLGWGVGGIEAEAAMLGQPISMLIPEVVGFRLTGALGEGVTATDLVLTVTEMLRAHGVVGKFVEFYGPGLDHLALEDQATIANMAPEYGATCGFFPTDAETIAYLAATGRDPARIALVEAYAKAQGLWRESETADPVFSETLALDLSSVEPSLAGPKRPQDRVPLKSAAKSFEEALTTTFGKSASRGETLRGGEPLRGGRDGGSEEETSRKGRAGPDPAQGDGAAAQALSDGDVVIAAITSCTNTSNPSVMIAAGLLARKARERGLMVKPWVKTSLAPGSKVVSDYLAKSGLQDDLDALGFALVGYGCTTCIGNSGPLAPEISRAIAERDLVVCSVLSGNRNFEGRINPDIRANYLASPPLVVAYALAGTIRRDLMREPLGHDAEGRPVYLKDIWPSAKEVAELIRTSVNEEMFRERYAHVFEGDDHWRALPAPSGAEATYAWDPQSTYVKRPPYFEGLEPEPQPPRDIKGARILGLFLDSITTDHISPAGAIVPESPAGRYLIAHGVEPRDFNSYGARRGNHEVMMRGTFANIRIRNQMLEDVEGGYTRHWPSGEQMTMYDAAMRYREEGVPLVVLAGAEYGTGSSRDWAAKGPMLLGVRAVIARSFERIHRSNLIGMGVLPLEFTDGQSWQSLGLKGDELISIGGLEGLRPKARLPVTVAFADGSTREIETLCRIDTEDEHAYFRHGGILAYVLRELAGAPS